MILPSLATSSPKRTEILKNTPCPNCHRKDEIRAVVFIKYISFALFPVFPLYKFLRLKCCYCFTKVKEKELSLFSQEECRKLKRKVPYEVKYFLYLIIIAFFLIMSLLFSLVKELFSIVKATF